MKFPLVTVMKNLLHMFTASVGIAVEGQCTGVQNCSIGGKLAFLPRVVSQSFESESEDIQQESDEWHCQFGAKNKAVN